MFRFFVVLLLAVVSALGLCAIVRGQQAENGVVSDHQEKLKKRDLFWKESQQFARQGRFIDAIATAERVLSLERSIPGFDPQKPVTTLKFMAGLREHVGHFVGAEKDRREVLHIQVKQFGEKSWQALDAKVALENGFKTRAWTPDHRKQLSKASALQQTVIHRTTEKKYADAIPLAQQSLAIRQKLLGDLHPSTVKSMNMLGILQYYQKDYAAARPLFEQALALSKKIQGEEHPFTATVCMNLGKLQLEQGNHAAAQASFTRAFNIHTKISHPDIDISFNGLTKLLQAQADQAERKEDFPGATKSLQSLHTLQKQRLGEDHWQVTDTRLGLQRLENLSRLDVQARKDLAEAEQWMAKAFGNNQPGKYAEAAEYAEKALAVRLRLLGKGRESGQSANAAGFLWKRDKQYQKSRDHLLDALTTRKKVLGDNHPDTARSLSHLAVLNTLEGKYVQAQRYAEQALAIYKKVRGDSHADTAMAQGNLANVLFAKRDYAGARPFYEQALAIRMKTVGDDHMETAHAHADVGYVLLLLGQTRAGRVHLDQAEVIRTRHFQGDNTGKDQLAVRDRLSQKCRQLEKENLLAEAIACAEKGLALERSIFAPVHQDIIASLEHLATLMLRKSELVGAEEKAVEIVSLQKKRFPESHWQITNARLFVDHIVRLRGLSPEERSELAKAESMEVQAYDLMRKEKFTEAVVLLEKSLTVRIRLLGDTSPYTAESLTTLAVVADKQRNSAEARVNFEKTLEIRKKILGEDHPKTAQTHFFLGALLLKQKEPSGARAHLEKALAIRKKTLGDEHPDTRQTLEFMAGDFLADLVRSGQAQEKLGDYAAARSNWEQALVIRKKLAAEDDRGIARTLGSLALLCQKQQDHASSRAYLEQALALQKKTLGDHEETAQTMTLLGTFLYRQGNPAAARPYYEQALAMRKKIHKDPSLETAYSLDMLGSFLTHQGEYTEARKNLEQALAIRQKLPGTKKRDTALSLIHLGDLLLHQESNDAARAYYEKAHFVLKDCGEDAHLALALCVNNLGVVHSRRGDFKEALNYFEQGLAAKKAIRGNKHLGIGLSFDNIGTLLLQQGEYDRARDSYEKALQITRLNLDLAACSQSEREQLLMGSSLRGVLNSYLSLPCKKEAATLAAYGHVLAWKGSVLAHQQRLRLDRQDPQVAPLVAKLRAVTNQLARLAFDTPDPKNRDAWTREFEALTGDKEALERKLAEKSKTFQQDQDRKNLSPLQLLALLPPDTVLVDFLVYRHVEYTRGKWGFEDRLTAFVLRPGKTIARLNLGLMEPIEKAIDEWRGMTQKNPSGGHPGLKLRHLLWEPLGLAGAKTVLVSPDGALGRLPFAALPGSKPGTYLLEEVAVSVVPVPRLLAELLSKDPNSVLEPSLLVVGDIDYDADGVKNDRDGRVATPGHRRAWKPLRGTLGEILTIQHSFQKRFAKAPVAMLSGEHATDAKVREFAPKFSILHLATHGFFAPAGVHSALDTDAKKNPIKNDPFGEQGVAGFNPGLLTGLVFAGANRPANPNQSDGILTAIEVAELDLSKLELAVLSACETGLGKVAAGEGVLGLQRAFQVAGAKSVVASLWRVDDDATRSLMERFYENHWGKKMSKQEALRQAQISMLAGDLGRRGVQRDDEPANRLPPHFWAAFVLSGDWR